MLKKCENCKNLNRNSLFLSQNDNKILSLKNDKISFFYLFVINEIRIANFDLILAKIDIHQFFPSL